MPQFSKNSNDLVQSDYLYLQSAGSPGNSDGSAEGIHLRWDLRGNLGDQHFPKGNLASSGTYQTSIGFNKNNDFVKIYRRPKNLSPVQVNVNSLTTGNIQDNTANKEWVYSSGNTVITFRFTDPNEYEALKQKHNLLANPSSGSVALLNEYSGVVEVHVNKLFIGAKFTFGEGELESGGDLNFRVEGISKGSEEATSSPVISHRKEVDLTGSIFQYEFFEENLQFLRFSNLNGSNTSIHIYTYDAEIFGPSWSLVKQLALTDSTSTADERLEDSPRFNLDNWPKYNVDAKVVKANYSHRWSANNGILEAVQQYLTLSKTDVYAKQVYGQSNQASSNNNDDDAKIEFSVLNALKIMSLDYHIARMLGLGYIDTPGAGDYLYLAVYSTEDPLEPGDPATNRDHYFMSLPVSRQEERPTLQPVQAELEFGLYYDQGQGQRTYITDSQGYAKTEDKRYVRINLDPQAFPRPLEPFFAGPSPIEASKHTNPVAYGIEYKDSGANDWISPELNHHQQDSDNPNDTPYLDNNGDQETEMIFFSGTNPLYLHSETSEGTHIYGVYGINWFSRASPVSNTRQETTAFPDRLNLLPPSNIRPQLIQPESPLIFTTSSEQDRYEDNKDQSSDTTLLRVQLAIDHRHNIAHKDSDKIQFFFRQNPANTVEGQVKSVVDTSPYTCRVRTEDYVKASVNTVVTPAIPSGEESHYIGSFLVVENEQYEIISVQQSGVSGEGPLFEINKIKDNSVITTGNQQQAISSQYKAPEAGKKFTALENLLDPNQWTQLVKEVTITSFSSHQETQYLADGTPQVLDIGGIYEPASVQADPANAGFYDITFNSYVLQDHSDGNVSWRAGVARIPLNSNPATLKEVEVVELELDKGSLEMKVYDNNQTEPIKTGSNININLFPGYNIYLYAEPGFGEAETLPATGEMTRLTYIAARTKDSSLNIDSYLSPAKPIIAREIVVPKPTGKPLGNSYATRPDFYGKASYTFDTLLDTSGGRQPFSLVFYRANTEGLLRALYKESTYQNLKTQLKGLRDDPDYNSFWIDLINMELENDKFKLYSNSGFQFPNPDRVYNAGQAEFDASKDPGHESSYRDMVKDKMMNAFVPLTEQPVLYMYLQSGKVTSPKKPNIRDENGNLIPPTSSDFDQAPMASKFSDSEGSKVRFTDYNLDGASQDLYFYSARELSNDYKFSAFSEIEKPVRILNSMPFSAPVIQVIESVPGDPTNAISPGVRFEIGQYAAAQNVTHVKVYRALTAADAKSVRTMAVQAPFNLTDDPLKDEFADLAGDIPFGEPLFYRLVACRTILNEDGDPELIDSLPSDILLSNVVDNTVPVAPELTATYSGPTGSPSTITGVNLKWDKAVHNGSYILYKMNAAGNWNKIHQITGDNAADFTLPLLSTDLADSDLVIEDDEGSAIYHHFKLEVINASGLSSKNENILSLVP